MPNFSARRSCKSQTTALPYFAAVVIAVAAFGAPRLAPRNQPPAPASQLSIALAVADGTRFLVRLNEGLNTGRDRANTKFTARTIEPLETTGGKILPANLEIRGHINRVEPAAIVGRARLWLTFDDIRANGNSLPIVADVADVPGDSNVRSGGSREGAIEPRTSSAKRDLEAAAGGATAGAAAGAKVRGPKAAAVGALAGGIAGFLLASGLGQEIDLPKDTTLELVLGRPLYLTTR